MKTNGRATLSEQEAQLRSLQLRHRFEDHRWSAPLWQSLQHVGVVYHSNSTYHYNGLTFENSKYLLQGLDHDAMPEITNRLELPNDNKGRIDRTEQECNILKELREKVLLHLFQNTQGALEPLNTPINMKKATIDRVIQPRETRQSNTKSVTVVEAGADLLLRGQRKRRRKEEPAGDILTPPQQLAALFSVPDNSESYSDTDFEDWRFILSTNHSVMLYGLGSKHQVLERFCHYIQSTNSGDVLTIQGYHRDVTFGDILDLMVQQFLNGMEPKEVHDLSSFKSVGISSPALLGAHPWVIRAMAIGQGLAQRAAKCKRPLFWCLHNIDGVGLQNRTVQQGIAALLVHARVTKESAGLRLIASVDHINASAMLWDTQTQANLAICWKQVHTYQAYLEEMQWSMEEDKHTKSLHRLKSEHESEEMDFTHVLSALSPRHTEVLLALASLQLALPDNSPVPHQELFQRCKHKCVVTSDKELCSFLTELVDHGIVERGREGGRVWLRIPYKEDRLRFILASCDNRSS